MSTDRLADVPAALVAAVDREDRRRYVAGTLTGPDASPGPAGIDFIEVVPLSVSADLGFTVHRQTILVHLLAGPVPNWTGENVAVVGGVRADPDLNPVDVDWAHPAATIIGEPPLPAGVTPNDRTLVARCVADTDRDRVFVVRTLHRGDLSDYQLRIVENRTELPDDLDPPLAQDAFSFRVNCPEPLDCRTATADAVRWSPQPVLDYLARDAEALTGRLLDRVATLVPGLHDRNAADMVTVLADLWAYLGDRWAYAQDAAAAEAYLSTARLRTSVRRHVRPLGYPMHDGCAARTWIAFHTKTDVPVPVHTPVSDTGPVPGSPAGKWTTADALDAGAHVFETTRAITATAVRSVIAVHAWADRSHTLAAGARAAFLSTPAGDDPRLRAGDVLILAELILAEPPGEGAELPTGGAEVRNGDPRHRYAVRLERDAVLMPDTHDLKRVVWEIRWVAEDALPGPLTVCESRDGRVVCAVALGNVVLADEGAGVHDESLAQPGEDVRYRPRLGRAHLAFVDAVDELAGPSAGADSASAASVPALARARAALTLLERGYRRWSAQRDLLGSTPTDTHVVAEVDDDGVAWLRFGSGGQGRIPGVGAEITADYRVGSGAAGNVAAGTLTEVIGPLAGLAAWNPLPAKGGLDPEAVEAVRRLAPESIHTPYRAVTTEDYAVTAQTVPGVQRAIARRRWTGSWYAVEATLDPVAAHADDPRLPAEVLELLELRRMAGLDVAASRPLFAPLHIGITGCVAAGYLRAHVLVALRAALSARRLPGGALGVFHPDRFSFGQPLALSDVVAAAMAVPGVAWVDVTRFGRLDDTGARSAANLAAGSIAVGPREVLCCASDPNNPETGRVDIDLRGGA